ncbi:MAG TPA: PLDc N-terminal domain-containing protein, partial [Candidatus Dormibacteraeota bacterium]
MTVPQIAVSSITLGAALIAASHAIIYKREPRSAAIWVIVIFLLPLLGPTFYLIIGIN